MNPTHTESISLHLLESSDTRTVTSTRGIDHFTANQTPNTLTTLAFHENSNGQNALGEYTYNATITTTLSASIKVTIGRDELADYLANYARHINYIVMLPLANPEYRPKPTKAVDEHAEIKLDIKFAELQKRISDLIDTVIKGGQ